MADITSELIGWWKLDDGSGLSAIDSKNGNNGTLENGPTWTAPGKIGPFCLSFDGSNDQVNLGSPAILDNLTQYTLSAWVNFTGQGYILGKSFGTAGWLWGPIASGPNFFLRLSQVFTTNSGQWDSNAGSILPSTWQHAVVTYQVNASNDPLMYINGSSVTVNETGIPSGTASDDAALNAYIGNRTAAPSGVPFTGLIDEVRIYNRILTPDDIMELFVYTGTGVAVSSYLDFPKFLLRPEISQGRVL